MRLLSLCHDALPAHFTNTAQLISTVAELSKLGHQIGVACRKSEISGISLRQEIARYYGLEALPASLEFGQVGPAGIESTLRQGAADIMNVFHACKAQPDVVHTRDFFALSLALAAGLRCLFETYRVDMNTNWKFATWRAFTYRHRNLLGVVTHSELCRRSFIDAGVPSARVATIYNGYSPAHFTPALTRESARARLNLSPSAQIVTYAGHMDAKKGVEILVQLASRLPEVTFLLVGATPGSEEKGQMRRLIEEIGAPNVHLLPRVSQPEVASYLFASDCLIIPPTAAPLFKHRRTVLPMKTFSYLAAGRVIVAPDLPDLREILRPDSNALLVSPDDVDAATAAIRIALSNSGIAEALGSAARHDAQQYTWQRRAQRFSAFLETVFPAVHLADSAPNREFARLL